MPQTPHVEQHFTAGETVRDIVIGMSDGLTVPFALAAGLTGAVSSSNVIIIAGLAEIAAGSIAMGLGGFLAARGDMEHYISERKREELEIKEKTQAEKEEVMNVLKTYGLTEEESTPIVEALSKRPKAWLDFMMRFIAMGLGGYLAARGDAEHYASERKREELEIKEKTQADNIWLY